MIHFTEWNEPEGAQEKAKGIYSPTQSHLLLPAVMDKEHGNCPFGTDFPDHCSAGPNALNAFKGISVCCNITANK